MPDPAPTSAQPGTYIDPYRDYNFKVDLGTGVEGHFTACSSIDISIHSQPHREGGGLDVCHQLPGQVYYGDVELHFGLTSSTELWDWFMSAVQGRVSRKNVSIILLDTDGVTEVRRWNLINAWPKRWKGAALDARGNEVAIARFVLTAERIEQA